MKKGHYEDHILAGTVGFFSEDPDGLGPLVVQPLIHGSILPGRRGYRWIVKNQADEVLFIPLRHFIPEKFFEKWQKEVDKKGRKG